MTSVNLIPHYRLERWQRARRIRWWLVGTGGYVALMAGLVVTCSTIGDQAVRAVQVRSDELDQRVDQARQALFELEPEVAEAQLQLQASRAVSQQADWSILLALLGRLCSDDVILSQCSLTQDSAWRPSTVAAAADDPPEKTEGGLADGTSPDAASRVYRLELRGMGLSQAAISRFLLRLEEVELFGRVKLIGTMPRPFGKTSVTEFQATCWVN